MFDGYLNLGGTEVLNQARAYELMTGQSCPSGWIRCMPCPGLEDADGSSADEYRDVRNAPWYDQEIEATHRFLGFYPVEVEGLSSSTRTAEIQEGILDGGVVQGARRAVREIRVRGLMVGAGKDALEEGVSWLDSVLEGAECSTHQGTCGEVDACFYSACPPERPLVTDYTPWFRGTENFATNPSLEATSGTVEIRRNTLTNPRLDNSIAGWSYSAPVVLAAQVGGALVTFPNASTSLPAAVFNSPAVVAVPGESWYAAIDVTVPVGQPAGTFTLTAKPYAGGSSLAAAESAETTIQPGTTVRLVAPVVVAPATTDGLRLWLNVRGAGVQAGSQITIKNAIIEKSTINTAPYFDGSTQPADPDLTPSWTGTADASASILSGAKVPGVAEASVGQLSPTFAYSTTAEPANRSRAARWITATAGSIGIPVTFATAALLVTGKVFTLRFKVRPSRLMNIAPRIRGATGPIVTCPAGVWTQMSLTIAAGPDAADRQTGGLLSVGTGGHQVGDTIDIDEVLLVEGEYNGGYFDGTDPDEEFLRGTWTGTPDASTSVLETRTSFEAPISDADYDELLFPLRRRLHGVVAISGPLITEQFHRREFYGYLVEFTLAATTPYVFGEQRPLVLGSVPPTVMQDKPYNLIPYPSAEIASSGTVVVATNYAKNPSVEVNSTDWSTSMDNTKILSANVVGARSTELDSLGSASYKVTFTAPSSGSGGWFGGNTEPTIPAGAAISISMWAAGSVQSGTAVLGDLEIVAYWRSGSTTLRTDILDVLAGGSGSVSVKSLIPPAGATSVIVRARQYVTSWSSGAIVRVYVDAAAITVP